MSDLNNARLERLEEALAHLQLQLSDLDNVLRENSERGLETEERLKRLERAVRRLRDGPATPEPIPSWVGHVPGAEDEDA